MVTNNHIWTYTVEIQINLAIRILNGNTIIDNTMRIHEAEILLMLLYTFPINVGEPYVLYIHLVHKPWRPRSQDCAFVSVVEGKLGYKKEKNDFSSSRFKQKKNAPVSYAQLLC